MKNGLVIADAGPIFSLAVVKKLGLLNELFDDIKIPKAVWEEITLQTGASFHANIVEFFKNKIVDVKGFNELTFMMDYGESEAVILYKEQKADFLLIDDKKARRIAENFGMNCIGTIGLLLISKEKGLINELRPIFLEFLRNKRFYSINLLNRLLNDRNESPLNY
ncbi:DUF3368 domain-containing protein [Pleomorphovibrio marinus]|uniref:DUF3368 domain-containing protein n=1 Tax=Pleomorphovibrio marinus TaxID=2164132 RepID=UPI000E0A9E93|nr:DUF3368 domain-containing protein [Pleomorphovibrio marinus]